MSAGRILIIEDEKEIRRFLRVGLESQEFEIVEATSIQEGIGAAATHNPGLILLDLGLPDGDGIEVIRRVREWSKLPIVILSARDQEGDKIRGLDAGADDYLTKPFSLGELSARVRALFRRVVADSLPPKMQWRFGSVEVDLAAHRVVRDSMEVHLTPIEFQILTVLLRNAGKVIPHKLLLREVWGHAYTGETQYLRVHVGNVRKKLEDDSAQPRYILTEPGVGYRFVDDELSHL